MRDCQADGRPSEQRSPGDLAEIVRGAVAGEPAAQRRFYEAYANPIARWIRSLRLPPDLRDDLFNEFWWRLFYNRAARLSRYRPVEGKLFEHWLQKSLRNFAISEWSHGPQRWRKIVLLDRLESWDRVGSIATSNPLLLLALETYIARLPLIDQEIVKDRFAGCSHKDIAEARGISAENSAKRYCLARKKLAEFVQQDCKELMPPTLHCRSTSAQRRG